MRILIPYTRNEYRRCHYIFSIFIPLILIFLVGYLKLGSDNSAFTGIGITAFTSFLYGAQIYIKRLRFEWQDVRAFERLCDPRYELEEYSVSKRPFFLNESALEAFQDLASMNSLHLEVLEKEHCAKVNKSHLANFKRNSNKP